MAPQPVRLAFSSTMTFLPVSSAMRQAAIMPEPPAPMMTASASSLVGSWGAMGLGGFSSSEMAPMGHFFTHFPQEMHLLWSMRVCSPS